MVEPGPARRAGVRPGDRLTTGSDEVFVTGGKARDLDLSHVILRKIKSSRPPLGPSSRLGRLSQVLRLQSWWRGAWLRGRLRAAASRPLGAAAVMLQSREEELRRAQRQLAEAQAGDSESPHFLYVFHLLSLQFGWNVRPVDPTS